MLEKASLPGIHPAVDDWIVHGVGHGQPVGAQENLLDVSPLVDLLKMPRNDEVNVVGQPANGKDGHDDDHHFDDLSSKKHKEKVNNHQRTRPLAYKTKDVIRIAETIISLDAGQLDIKFPTASSSRVSKLVSTCAYSDIIAFPSTDA